MRRLSAPALLVLSLGTAVAQDLPKGYQQVVPRGRIAAVDEPSYVPAAEADVRDDAWVLGVEIAGKSRAYVLALLNAYEVVNDSIGQKNFAAVW